MKGVPIFGDKAIEAVREELTGIIDNAVGEPTRWRDIPVDSRQKIQKKNYARKDEGQYPGKVKR